MKYSHEIDSIVNSLEKQYKNLIDEKSAMKLSRYFGYSIGFLGSAIVPPYSYQFGERISNYFFGDHNHAWEIFISVYFSVVSTITLGSLGINVCGEIFPETLQLIHDNPFNKIKVRSSKEKIYLSIGMSAVVLLSLISNIPGTYLTDQAYRDLSPLLAVIFDVANQIAWSTVSAWSLYAIPEQIYKEFASDFCFESKNPRSNLFKKTDNLLKEISFATEQELNNLQMEFFPEDKFTTSSLFKLVQFKSNFPSSRTIKSRLRKLIGTLGMMIGMVSMFFYYPIGKASGQMLAKFLRIEDYSLYFEAFMAITTYSSQVTPAMLGTKHVFELVYDRIGNLCVIKNSKSGQPIQEPLLYQRETQQQPSLFWPKIKAIFYVLIVFFFAITASSYRAELTAEYAPNSASGLFLIALSSISASCIGWWSLDKFASNITKKSDISLQSKLMQRTGLFRVTIDKMDDRHLNALMSIIDVSATIPEC